MSQSCGWQGEVAGEGSGGATLAAARAGDVADPKAGLSSDRMVYNIVPVWQFC